MYLRKIRHLIAHTPGQLLARAKRWSARSGWDHLLHRHAQLLRRIGIGVALLAALILTMVLIINADHARPPGIPPATTTTTTTPARSSEQLTTPAPAPGQRPVPEPPTATEVASYIVVDGDTLAAIALAHGVAFEQLAADNIIADPNHVRAGQRLSIRPPAAGVEVIQPGATLSSYALHTGLSVAALLVLNPHITEPDHILAGGALRLSPGANR